MRGFAAAAALLLTLANARAETRTYVIAIGNDAPPADGTALEPLRYADDDAADFFSFASRFTRAGWLLTVLDADSQQRFPALPPITHPPTLAELDRVLGLVRARMDADVREGHEPVLLFFYSGHGTRGSETRPPALTLLDGGLTRELLYQRVLAPLPARYIHIFVDACHAEAVVRPRDASAKIVKLDEEDVRAYAERTTLDRFPNVGAVVATSSEALAHEWDAYQRGVFSHELLSGLRGAADVNGDGLVEYSELQAFLAAANREVVNPRAHVDMVVRPPAINRRAPLVDLRSLAGVAHLVGRADKLGPLWVEDARGNRLADLHGESGARSYVTLPAGEPLFLHARDRLEAALLLGAGEVERFESLRLRRTSHVSRGALDESLSRGLFAEPFGPRYYHGFVDRDPEPVPVSFVETGALLRDLERPPPSSPSGRRRLRAGAALLGSGAALAVVGGVFGGLAATAKSDFFSHELERPQFGARDRFYGFQAAAAVTLGLSLATLAVGTWTLARR